MQRETIFDQGKTNDVSNPSHRGVAYLKVFAYHYRIKNRGSDPLLCNILSSDFIYTIYWWSIYIFSETVQMKSRRMYVPSFRITKGRFGETKYNKISEVTKKFKKILSALRSSFSTKIFHKRFMQTVHPAEFIDHFHKKGFGHVYVFAVVYHPTSATTPSFALAQFTRPVVSKWV